MTRVLGIHIGILASLLSICSSASCMMSDDSDDLRPITVPAEYITTPYGYIHPDCIQTVDEDEMIQIDGVAPHIAQQPDGSDPRDLTACTHPRFDSEGAIVSDDETAPSEEMNLTNEEPDTSPGGTNWFESADSKKIGAVSYVHAQWNIPSAPKSRRGQRVYFFPGLVNSKLQATTILQPVLGWNQADSNIEGWSLASWNCCKKGKVHHSKFIPAPGSMVSGDIIGLDCNNGVCSKWRIVSYDWASHRSTILNTTAFGLKMNWIFGGVLEAPGVRKCNQLPPDPVTFSDFIINDSDGRHVSTPSWNKTFWRHRPDCDFHISSSGDRVTLHY